MNFSFVTQFVFLTCSVSGEMHLNIAVYFKNSGRSGLQNSFGWNLLYKVDYPHAVTWMPETSPSLD